MGRFWFCKLPPAPDALHTLPAAGPEKVKGFFLKTSDGPHWERHWHPTAPDGPGAVADFIQRVNTEGEGDRRVWAWHVARGGTDAQFSAEMAILTALEGVDGLAGVCLDAEPFPRYYWRGSYAQITQMRDALSAWQRFHILSYDPRRGPWARYWLMKGAFSWLAPQVYWRAFGQKPEVALQEFVANDALTLNRSVIPTLPADADPDELAAAVAWCDKRNLDHALFTWDDHVAPASV